MTASERYQILRFEALREENLPLLYLWLREPHVREFYHRWMPTWDDVRQRYLRVIDPAWPARSFLIHAHAPLGYIQTYRLADLPPIAAALGESAGLSVDLFIGQPRELGVGWGRLILRKFLAEVAFSVFPTETRCWIAHDKRNSRALGASQAAGFRYVRDIVEEGNPEALLVYERAR